MNYVFGYFTIGLLVSFFLVYRSSLYMKEISLSMYSVVVWYGGLRASVGLRGWRRCSNVCDTAQWFEWSCPAGLWTYRSGTQVGGLGGRDTFGSNRYRWHLKQGGGCGHLERVDGEEVIETELQAIPKWRDWGGPPARQRWGLQGCRIASRRQRLFFFWKLSEESISRRKEPFQYLQRARWEFLLRTDHWLWQHGDSWWPWQVYFQYSVKTKAWSPEREMIREIQWAAGQWGLTWCLRL